ncbi:MAG: hypothetical protein ACTSWW_08115 [Promethearchaeota archaeon]
MKVNIIPRTVKQGTLHYDPLNEKDYPLNPKLVENTTILALSLVESKPYSFFTMLKEVSNEKPMNTIGTLPTLVVDRYITGPLAPSDPIDLYPYNIPFAETVTISISERYHQITSGDGTPTLRDLMSDQLCDYGSVIKVPLSMAEGKLTLRGHVAAADPSLPAIIGSTTRIFLQKLPDNALEKEQLKLEHRKIKRTEKLRDEVRITLHH